MGFISDDGTLVFKQDDNVNEVEVTPFLKL